MRNRLLVILIALTCTGCVSRESTPPAPHNTTIETVPTRVATTTLPTAADGADLLGCAADDCEVEVTGLEFIPLGERHGVASVQIRSVDADTVDLLVIVAGVSSFECLNDPECVISTHGAPQGSAAGVTAHQDAVVTAADQRIEVRSIRDGTAILRFSGL